MDFSKFAPSQIGDLTPNELIELAEFLVKRDGYSVTQTHTYSEFYDAPLLSPNGSREYLRIYFGSMPANVAYVLLTELEGQHYSRVRLWCTGRLTEAQRHRKRDVPLALELLDLNDLKARLANARRLPVRRAAKPPSRPFQNDNYILASMRRRPLDWLLIGFLVLFAVVTLTLFSLMEIGFF